MTIDQDSPNALDNLKHSFQQFIASLNTGEPLWTLEVTGNGKRFTLNVWPKPETKEENKDD